MLYKHASSGLQNPVHEPVVMRPVIGAMYQPLRTIASRGDGAAQRQPQLQASAVSTVNQVPQREENTRKQYLAVDGKYFHPEPREACREKMLNATGEPGRKIFLDMGAHDGSSIPEFIGNKIGLAPTPVFLRLLPCE